MYVNTSGLLTLNLSVGISREIFLASYIVKDFQTHCKVLISTYRRVSSWIMHHKEMPVLQLPPSDLFFRNCRVVTAAGNEVR